jgi:hypothetical protein
MSAFLLHNRPIINILPKQKESLPFLLVATDLFKMVYKKEDNMVLTWIK